VLASFNFFQKKKGRGKENIGFITYSEQDKRKENFTLFGRLMDDRQKFSNILE
jgi:hypothetical protein